MSTKIYNGYRLPMMDMPAFDAFIKKIRTRMRRKALALFYEELASIVAWQVDKVALFGAPATRSHLSEAYHTLRDAFDRVKKGIRMPPYDWDFNICVFPYRDSILVMTFHDNRELNKVWEETLGVTEYAYWNNTDEPEGMTRAEWKKRERDWDGVLGKEAIPSINGYSIELSANSWLPLYMISEPEIVERIERALPNYKERVKRAALELAYRDLDARGVRGRPEEIKALLPEMEVIAKAKLQPTIKVLHP